MIRAYHDAEGTRVDAPWPDDAERSHWVDVGDFQGADYARNAFARDTEVEVAALVDRLDLRPGHRVLDVGCGNGRHLHALAARGIVGIGVDASPGLVDAARTATVDHSGPVPSFHVADARRDLPAIARDHGPFDVVLSLHQGAFGTSPDGDRDVLDGIAASLAPGGLLAITAFHAPFLARHLDDGDAYDAVHGLLHHTGEVRGPDGTRRDFDLWTTAYTAGEVRLLLEARGLTTLFQTGCEPGRYDGDGTLTVLDPEFLTIARAG